MAKTEGPLMSVEARGKLADSLVFFPWKGRHAVRRWLKPTQPKSTLQGYVRAALYAIGKWISKVGLTSAVVSGAKAVMPAGYIWNAFLAEKFLEQNVTGGEFDTAKFASLISQYSALPSAVLTAFKTNATALGLSDFAFDYGYTNNIEAGCQLFFGALACYEGMIYTTGIYTKHPTSWAATEVDSFKSDCV